jgi:TonB family protein
MKSSTATRLFSACLLAGAALQANAGEIARFDPNECNTPTYNRDWERNEESGQVLLSFQVDAKGKVMAIKVVQSSGWPDLDSASVRALKQCVFKKAASESKNWESVRYTWVLK